MNPHFLFGCAEKKTAVHGQKKRRFGAKPAPKGAFLLQYGNRANRCGKNLAGFCRVRRTLEKQGTCFPAFGGLGAAFGVVVGFGPFWPRAFRFATRYRSLSPGRVSKGEGPQPRPFVSFQGGPGENRNPPGFSLGGVGGHFSFQKRNVLPFPRPPEEGRFTDRLSRGAYSYTSARPGHGSTPRWGWCGYGCLPPPGPGW